MLLLMDATFMLRTSYQ